MKCTLASTERQHPVYYSSQRDGEEIIDDKSKKLWLLSKPTQLKRHIENNNASSGAVKLKAPSTYPNRTDKPIETTFIFLILCYVLIGISFLSFLLSNIIDNEGTKTILKNITGFITNFNDYIVFFMTNLKANGNIRYLVLIYIILSGFWLYFQDSNDWALWKTGFYLNLLVNFYLLITIILVFLKLTNISVTNKDEPNYGLFFACSIVSLFVCSFIYYYVYGAIISKYGITRNDLDDE